VERLFATMVPLALALLACLALGRAASRLGIPRVTVYLLVGLALGPHVGLRLFDPAGPAGGLLLSSPTEGPLRAVEQLAIGFIMFGIGSQFRFENFRREGPRVLAISAFEIATTGLLVGAAVWAVTADWRLATIAPALAVSSAPSATLVTLREVEAEGPTTRVLLLCVGQNNLIALLMFPLLLALAFGAAGVLVSSALALAALAIGAVLGFVAAVFLESVTGRRELVLLGLLVVLAALGIGSWMGPGATSLGMLGCFGAGVAIANGSPHAEPLFRYLENTVYPLYVLFFISAGRNLHVEEVATAGLLGLVFVAGRVGGKMLGAWAGLRSVGWQDRLPGTFGAGLLCQAGIALGLVSALANALPEATAELRHVVVASVVVFELAGPWLVRGTVVRAGEVKLANLFPHAEARGLDAVNWVLLELRRNLGLLRADLAQPGAEATVAQAMRRQPETVREDLPFERVLKTLSETSAELVPVIDSEGGFRGVVSYEDVKNALYEPALRGLVVARDVATPIEAPLPPGASLAAALELMDAHRVHSWPVVERGRLLGMVRRSDVYAFVRSELRRATREKVPTNPRPLGSTKIGGDDAS
jgi:Kef-type K+ transport system membrane component KefB/CBS domain-containing protein